MGIFDRVILSLYALAFTVLALIGLIVSFGWAAPLNSLTNVLRTTAGKTSFGIVSGIIFITGFRFIFLAFRRAPVQAVVHDTGMGEVNISLVAVKSLVTKVASKTPGVREVKANVKLNPLGTGIEVAFDLKVASDANLPDLADKVQKATSSYVHDIVGVAVDFVTVSVSDISLEGRR